MFLFCEKKISISIYEKSVIMLFLSTIIKKRINVIVAFVASKQM